MITGHLSLVAVAVLTSAPFGLSLQPSGSLVEEATAFFTRFVHLEQAYDARVADL